MIKADLLSSVSEILNGYGLSKDRSERTNLEGTIVSTIFNTIKAALLRGEEVKIPNFGKFYPHPIKSQLHSFAINSPTGKFTTARYSGITTERVTVKFKPWKSLRNLVDDSRDPTREENS